MKSGKNSYITFCSRADLRPVATESGLFCFVSFLRAGGLKHYTIKSLSAVQHLHIVEGEQRLPISPNILCQLKAVWEKTSPSADNKMLWAVCCLALFGFLRAGEMTVPNNASYDPGAHLSFNDIAVDNSLGPRLIITKDQLAQYLRLLAS